METAGRKPIIDRSRTAILDAVTAALVDRPEATLTELAQRVGVGRTTLHRLFPTRRAVLSAVALDAITRLSEVYQDAGIDVVFTDRMPVASSWAAIRELVERLVPLGPRMMFLVRSRELDDDETVMAAVRLLDQEVESAVERGQQRGELDDRPSASWIAESLGALIYLAWEQVSDGRLASRYAADLVVRSWRSGVEPRG